MAEKIERGRLSPLMTTRQVCERLGIDSDALERMHAAGELARIEIASVVRYSRASVDELLEVAVAV